MGMVFVVDSDLAQPEVFRTRQEAERVAAQWESLGDGAVQVLPRWVLEPGRKLVYCSAPLNLHPQVLALHEELNECGIDTTSDWAAVQYHAAQSGEPCDLDWLDNRRRLSLEAADAFVLVLPAGPRELVELGLALSQDKPVLVFSPHGLPSPYKGLEVVSDIDELVDRLFAVLDLEDEDHYGGDFNAALSGLGLLGILERLIVRLGTRQETEARCATQLLLGARQMLGGNREGGKLLEAARSAVNSYDAFMEGEETYPEYHHEVMRKLREAMKPFCKEAS